MKLLVFKNNKTVADISLSAGTKYTVGRSTDCDVILEKFPGISRHHFEISEDNGGVWVVKVLSELMLITFKGERTKILNLNGNGEFQLEPYNFKFTDEVGGSLDAFSEITSNSDFDNADYFSNIKVTPDQADVPSDNEPFDGNDDKTLIQNFSGIPYLKIIGQNGKKSEYFRLEGNLWIVGGHESASVYIREVSAAQNHFEISKTDKGFFIFDSGSAQGTEINGQKLIARKATRILSGDIITVGETSMQFELRDKAFNRKVSNIPLNTYKNPLVFFDQEVAMVSLDEEDTGPGKAEELKADPLNSGGSRKRFILITAATLLVTIAVVSEMQPRPEKVETSKAIGSDPFNQLTPAEQKIVTQTHTLAKQLYLANDFELALKQLEKLHSVIPSYKDSKEMEEYCINSRELKKQQAMLEKQKRDQEEVEQRVNSYIAQCNQQYAQSDDIDGAKACLAPASDLDPNNPDISQLVTEVTARLEEKGIRDKIAAEQESKVRRGMELFEMAQRLHKGRDLLKAIEAYENHIHSGLPDPKNLVKKSKRSLATIEWKIKSEKTKLFDGANSMYGSTRLRDAIQMAREAQKVDPYDPNISAFIFKVEKELNSRMKNIYMDSVIEERFGNLEASRVKWEEIVKTDVDDGEYYKKANRKLKQYGFKH